MNESKTESLFGKNIHSLNVSDIETFFQSSKKENDVLEFKSYLDFKTPGTTKAQRDKEKVNEVIKTIVAFLNSDGGVLIWGAPSGNVLPGDTEKVFSGNIAAVEIKLETDQFINRIASEISPTPLRINFQAIPVGNTGHCYIIEVQRSDFSPHQHKGTYYMRMDGSTRPAPHHYVEALIKKITYPKIEGYLNFGTIQDFRDDIAAMPIQLTIHNLSKFTHERDLHYRIVAVGCDIINPYSTWQGMYRKFETDISKPARHILHYNMPFYEDFILITSRIVPRSNPLNLTIMLNIWGDLTPALMNTYKLSIFGDASSGRTRYDIVEKKENIYMHEGNESVNDTESERILKSNSFLLDSLTARFHECTVFRQLTRQQ